MKRFFRGLFALFMPWMILLAYDNPTGALVALFLQATIIGWIPAAIWAFRTIQQAETPAQAQAQDQQKTEVQDAD